MSSLEEKIKEYIVKYLKKKMGTESNDDIYIDEDVDLIESGIINSLSFITLITDLEEQYNIEIDFDELDPSEYTIISNLASLVAKTKE